MNLNCNIEYHRAFLSKSESQSLFFELVEDYRMKTQRNRVIGRDGNFEELDTSKLMFMDKELYEKNIFPEEYWGKTAIWPQSVRAVKEKVEKVVGRAFNIGVCIYYPDGNSWVDYHSDYVAFGDTNLIPSLSIGEERAFLLREKSSQKVHSFHLEDGSLFIMGDRCQQNYEHCLPQNPIYKNGRVNITFRPYGYDS